MSTVYVYCVCLLFMFAVYVCCLCLLFMFAVYIYCLCLLHMFTVYVYCLCFLSITIVCIVVVYTLLSIVVFVFKPLFRGFIDFSRNACDCMLCVCLYLMRF